MDVTLGTHNASFRVTTDPDRIGSDINFIHNIIVSGKHIGTVNAHYVYEDASHKLVTVSTI